MKPSVLTLGLIAMMTLPAQADAAGVWWEFGSSGICQMEDIDLTRGSCREASLFEQFVSFVSQAIDM